MIIRIMIVRMFDILSTFYMKIKVLISEILLCMDLDC